MDQNVIYYQNKAQQTNDGVSRYHVTSNLFTFGNFSVNMVRSCFRFYEMALEEDRRTKEKVRGLFAFKSIYQRYI